MGCMMSLISAMYRGIISGFIHVAIDASDQLTHVNNILYDCHLPRIYTCIIHKF